MGILDSYFEWLYADEETFIDLNKGIFYSAHGKTRSMKGLFKNFGSDGKSSGSELTEFMKYLVDKGKLTEDELIEYLKKRQSRLLE